MALHESAFSPFFRENLLKSYVGETITDIVRRFTIEELKELYLYKSDEIRDYSLYSKFMKIGNYIELHFSNKKVLNISFVPQNNCFNIREAIRNTNKELKNDYLIAFNSRENRASFGINFLPNESSIKQLLGKTIKDVFLLKETAFFNERYFIQSRSDSKIIGFAFMIDNRRVSFYKGGFEKALGGWNLETNSTREKSNIFNRNQIDDPVNISAENIVIDIDDNILNNGIFTQTKEFCIPEKKYVGAHIRSYSYGNENRIFVLPEYEIEKEDTISIEEVLPGSLIDERILPKLIVRKLPNQQYDLMKNIYNQYKMNLDRQIRFFQKLKKSFNNKNCFLTELMFGLDKNGDFKIVSPVDVVPNNPFKKDKPYGNPYSLKEEMIGKIEGLIMELESIKLIQNA